MGVQVRPEYAAVAVYQPPANNAFFMAVVTGLKLLAVVVVVDAVWGMFSSFCKTRFTQLVMLVTALLLLLMPSMWMQLTLLFLMFWLGWFFVQPQHLVQPTSASKSPSSSTHSKNNGIWLKSLLLAGVPLVTINLIEPVLLSEGWRLFAQFLQAGAMVFGGGHVVLPLLQPLVADQLSEEVFLTGYALAQAVPGPMFTFATYLGAQLMPQQAFLGALLATLGVFLPGLLLMQLVLNHANHVWQSRKVQGGMAMLNAAVVGLLFATLVNPVATSALHKFWGIIWVLVGVSVLRFYRPHILWFVFAFAVLLPLIRLI